MEIMRSIAAITVVGLGVPVAYGALALLYQKTERKLPQQTTEISGYPVTFVSFDEYFPEKSSTMIIKSSK